jgi:hypothetical protein
VPLQIVDAEAEILTAGVTGVVTVIVTVLLVPVAVVKHIKLLVRTQCTLSPFVNVLLE